MKCLAVFLVLIGLSLALPVEKQNAKAENIDLDQLLSILNSQTATAQDSGKASTQSFSSIISKVGKVTNLLPEIVEIVNAVKDIVNGQARAQQEEEMTPEKFFQICCQIVMAQSEGEDISMIELCRRCCQVAEQLLDAGQGMTTDQFIEFCSSVAKEMMGQVKPPVAVDGAKAQSLVDALRLFG